uniref:L1 transposable element RRM domain-containing protein n=1 Tax=Labrus bergylta TaxID=56723 RepID=A0A3Q3E6I8_9LABR
MKGTTPSCAAGFRLFRHAFLSSSALLYSLLLSSFLPLLLTDTHTYSRVDVHLETNSTTAPLRTYTHTEIYTLAPSNATILLALQEQEDRLIKKLKLAVRKAVEDMLSGENETLKSMIESTITAVAKLGEDITQQAELGRKLQGRVDASTANMRAVKHDVGGPQKDVLKLHQKIAEMEDRSRRCNIRLVGLVESAEGENAIQFLQDKLPEWIPSLVGEKIKIQQAHRIYTAQDKSNRPRTLIFQLLRYQDREKILNGVRALPSAPTHQASYEGRTSTSRLMFFPDYSTETAQKRRAFDAVRKQIANRGLRQFLRYPATLKVKHNGTLHFFDSVADAEKFMSALARSSRSTPRPSAPNTPPRSLHLNTPQRLQLTDNHYVRSVHESK